MKQFGRPQAKHPLNFWRLSAQVNNSWGYKQLRCHFMLHCIDIFIKDKTIAWHVDPTILKAQLQVEAAVRIEEQHHPQPWVCSFPTP
jgi:hypothetical protein